MNHEKKPFDDKRVRRALTLALDRYQGSQALSQHRDREGGRRASRCRARRARRRPPSSRSWPATARDINKSRAEARRLLKEAGVPDGFSFTFKNRGVPMPYEPVGVWLIDQWRQIGLNVKQEVIEAAAYYAGARGGDFEVADGLPVRLHRRARPGPLQVPVQRTRARQLRPLHRTASLDELYEKQSRAIDAEEREDAASASSSGASSTRRCTTSTRCSGTASSRTARR